MSSTRVLSVGVAVGFLLGLVSAASPPPAHAAFNVGAQLRTIPITDTAQTTVDNISVDPFCGSQVVSSMAVMNGAKLKNVDPIQYPVLLAISWRDDGGGAASISR